MSSFLHTKYQALEAYTPGEQPRDKQYIKLNTNESPYPPSQAVLTALGEEDIRDLRLYSDPEGKALKLALARLYGMGADQVFLFGRYSELCFYGLRPGRGRVPRSDV